MDLSVNRLLLKAFYYLGEWNPNHAPDGWMITEALDLLNEMLAEWRSKKLLIPFLQTVEFTTTPGKAAYVFAKTGTYDVFSSKLASLEYVEFELDQVIYPVRVIPESEYYQNYRVKNLQTLMDVCFMVQATDSSIITFYPIPNAAYITRVRGRFALSDVEMGTDISSLPPEYVSLLYMGVAEKLQNFYETANWTKEKAAALRDMKEALRDSSFSDLWVKTAPSNQLMGGYRVMAGI